MAAHSGVLAWRIPGTGEPGGLPSMGSHRVRHDCSDLAVPYFGALQKALVHLAYFLPNSLDPSSIQEARAPLLEKSIGNQVWALGVACCFWSIVSFRAFQLTEQNTCVCVLTHGYTHIFTYFYM